MEYKKRKPSITIISSIIFPGLGHLYNGRIYLAISIQLIISIQYFLHEFVFMGNFITLIISLITFICFYLFVLIHSILLVKKNKKYCLKKNNKWYLYILFLTCFIIIPNLTINLIGHDSRYLSARVPTESMKPNFLLKDLIMIDNFYYKNHEIKRFDVITFKNEDEVLLFKRVIAFEGDKVEIKDYRLFVNDIYIDEFEILEIDEENPMLTRIKKELNENPSDDGLNELYDNFIERFTETANFGPIIVEQGNVFLLGDNRSNSLDSRYEGTIEIDRIIGKIIYKYYPKYVKY